MSQIPIQDPARTGNSTAQRINSAEITNKPINAVIDLLNHQQNNLPPMGSPIGFKLVEFWPAITTTAPSGYSDFTGADYWVQRQMVMTESASGHALASLMADATPPNIQVAYARNLTEQNASSHTLAAGTPIMVFGFDGRDGSGRRQYLFTRGGAGNPLFVMPKTSVQIGGTVGLAGACYGSLLMATNPGPYTLTGTTIGSDVFGSTGSTATWVYFINQVEVGTSNHDLISTYNTATVCIVLATLPGKSIDGYTVYSGIAVYFGCSITEEE